MFLWPWLHHQHPTSLFYIRFLWQHALDFAAPDANEGRAKGEVLSLWAEDPDKSRRDTGEGRQPARSVTLGEHQRQNLLPV